jgi:hypothetical protein
VKLGAYVVLIEPPARRADTETMKAAPLTPAAKIALAALADALNDVGVSPPAAERIPRCVAKVVTAEQWRTYAYRRQISKGKPRAQQAAFSRAQDLLLANGRVGVWDDHIWIERLNDENQCQINTLKTGAHARIQKRWMHVRGCAYHDVQMHMAYTVGIVRCDRVTAGNIWDFQSGRT